MQVWNNNAAINHTTYAVGGSNIHKYETMVDGGSFGIVPAATVNASALTNKKLHLDVYIPAGTNFQIKVVCQDGGGAGHEDLITKVVGTGGFVTMGWNSLDIDLSTLTNCGPYINKVFQIGIINGSGCGIIFLDNLYFY